MSIALVQSVNSGFIGSVPVAIAATGTGNLIAVMIEVADIAITVTSVTDDALNVYVHAPNTYALSTVGGASTDIWYAKNSIAGATAVLVTCSSSVSKVVEVAEYSGCHLTSPLDVSGGLSEQSGTPWVGPTLTITNGGDVLITTIVKNAVGTNGVDAPWSAFANNFAKNNVQLIAPGSTGAYAASYQPTSSDDWCASGAAFKPASTLNAKRWGTELVF